MPGFVAIKPVERFHVDMYEELVLNSLSCGRRVLIRLIYSLINKASIEPNITLYDSSENLGVVKPHQRYPWSITRI